MRRGYIKGLVIGGILGAALGKMWRMKEQHKQRDESRFFDNKEFDDFTNETLDERFDENAYLNEYSQYDDHEETHDSYEESNSYDDIVRKSEPYINEFAEEIHDGDDDYTKLIDEYRRRRKPARVQSAKRRKSGNH